MFGRKFDKNLLTGILASMALHLGGGYEAHRISDEAKQERLTDDREQVKDVIFLPTTKEELIKDLLDQAGVKDITEIQKNPELTHKIDLIKVFLEVEYLEKKIDAQEARTAYLNSQLQTKVFAEFYNKTGQPFETINKIKNHISDPNPDLFLNANDLAESNDAKGKGDYRATEALASSFFRNGLHNCYGATRVSAALIGPIFPHYRLKIQKFNDHVRLIVNDGTNDYSLEPGAPMRELTNADFAGTIVYTDAYVAFLSGILNLENPSIYFPSNGQTQNINTVSEEIKKNYNNTASLNYDDKDTAKLGNKKLKNYSENDVPMYAKTSATKLPKELIRKDTLATAPTSSDGTQNHQKQINPEYILRQAVIKGRTDIIKKTEHKKPNKNEHPTANKSEEETENKEVLNSPTGISINTPPTETQKARFVLIEAEMMIDAYIKEFLEQSDKQDTNTGEIMQWLKKIDEAGMLKKYIERRAEETRRLEAMRPKPGDKPNPYLAAKFLADDYVKKYEGLKQNFDEASLLYEATNVNIGDLELYKILQLDYKTSVASKQSNPLLPDSYEIKGKHLEDYLKRAEKILKTEKNKKDSKQFFAINFSDKTDASSITATLELAKKYPPKKIVIEGNFESHLNLLQDFLNNPKAKNTVIEWKNPPIGVSLEPIWSSIEKDPFRIRLFTYADEQIRDAKYRSDIKGEGYKTKDSDNDFPMIDDATHTIVNVNTKELRKKYGQEYLVKYWINQTLASNAVLDISIKDPTGENKLDPNNPKRELYHEFQDLIQNSNGFSVFLNRLEQQIQKFATSEQLQNGRTYNLEGAETLELSILTKIIPRGSLIKIKNSKIINFPTEDTRSTFKFEGCTFGDIPPEFLTSNSNIDFGDLSHLSYNKENDDIILMQNLEKLGKVPLPSLTIDADISPIKDTETGVFHSSLYFRASSDDPNIVSDDPHPDYFKFETKDYQSRKENFDYISNVQKVVDKFKLGKIIIGEHLISNNSDLHKFSEQIRHFKSLGIEIDLTTEAKARYSLDGKTGEINLLSKTDIGTPYSEEIPEEVKYR